MQIEQYSRTQLIIRKLFVYAIRLQVILILAVLGVNIYILNERDKFLCSHNELSRITAPDSNTDAVLIDEHCYLEAGHDTALYFVPVNGPIPNYAIFAERDIEVINSRWLSPNRYHLTYKKGNLEYELVIEAEG